MYGKPTVIPIASLPNDGPGVCETLDFCSEFQLLVAREDFIAASRRESFKSYINNYNSTQQLSRVFRQWGEKFVREMYLLWKRSFVGQSQGKINCSQRSACGVSVLLAVRGLPHEPVYKVD